MFELTQDQKEAIEVLNSDKPFVVVKGYAGTGKTTTVVEWLKNHRTNPIGRVLFTAPTNKATGVLEDMCREKEVPAECKTIHSALGLKMVWREDEQVLVPNSRLKGLPEFHSFDIVVIDECSMLDSELLGYIKEAQGLAKNRVIYMGDPAQLPPVNDGVELSDSFTVDTSTELQKIMRQSGESNIPALGLMLRNMLSERRPVRLQDLNKFADGESVVLASRQDMWEGMLEDFANTEDDVRYLAYRNDNVKSAIADIRARMYGKNAPELMAGEKVQALKPILNPIDETPDYSTDALVTLEAVQEDTYEDIPVWKVLIQGTWYMTVKGEFETRYKQTESRLRKECRAKRRPWRDFYKFINAFCWIRPAQGMTVHKSQGSTFDRVYVNASDILSVRWDQDLCKKLMYVACSRPRAKLVLLV